jgi:hypothetical protein
MTHRLLSVVLAVILLSALCATVWAAETCCSGPEVKVWGSAESKPKTSDKYTPDQAIIGIGRFDILTLHGGAVGFSIPEREVIVYNRLVEVLSNGPVNASAVCVKKVRSAPTVFVGNYRLISVYARDAKAAGLTQQALAEKWAQAVASVLPQVAPTNAAAKSGVAIDHEQGTAPTQ